MFADFANPLYINFATNEKESISTRGLPNPYPNEIIRIERTSTTNVLYP